VLPSLLEVGQDASHLRKLGGGPALGKPERGLITGKQTAEANVAALARQDRISGFLAGARGYEHFQDRRGNAKRNGRLVNQGAANRHIGGVLNGQLDFGGGGERRGMFPEARRFQFVGAGKPYGVENESDQRQGIPQKKQPDHPRRPPGRNNPDQAQEQHNEKSWTETERQPAQRLKRGDNFRRSKGSRLVHGARLTLVRSFRFAYLGTSTAPITWRMT